MTIDPARDLSAIAFVDDSPGCDAMGVPYSLVLRFRGQVPEPADIEVTGTRG